jgi:hypothetical protein
MRYFKTKYGTIINENNAVIPMDESSPLWLEYVAYLQNDGTIYDTDFLTDIDLEIQRKESVSAVITRRQFKIALAVLGKNENDILNGINQLPEPTRTIALISYTEAGTFERSNPELIFVGKTFLQMTDEQIDNVFTIGSQY